MADAQAGPDQRVTCEVDGPIATITNDNQAKRNAFDDAMDLRLFEIFGEIAGNPDIRAVIWRGEGPSFSSRPDVSAIRSDGQHHHHELMSRRHPASHPLLHLDLPVIV